MALIPSIASFGVPDLSTECARVLQQAGGCNTPNHGGGVEGNRVELWANANANANTNTVDSNNGSEPESDSDQLGSGSDEQSGSVDAGDPELVVGCADGSACEVNLPRAAPTNSPPQVSLSDLANFKPSAPVASMEPDGWTIVGLDTNFVAGAEAHVLSGELLGLPAQVRFTPDSYRWTFGDGISKTTKSSGATWDELAVDEFSATATSHVFRSSGEYTVGLEVSYSAEYRFAGLNWRAIAGTVPAAGNRLTVMVVEAKTVLVARDCIVDPAGLGC